MMREGGKGKAIWLAGVAAIAPVAIASIPVEPVQASPAEEFRPPQEPMVLTRTLRKHLSDGAEIVTRRSYEIHFVPESGGYVVEGRLLSVLVDAPPALQVLAEIERARRDKDMFPIKVDRTGRLVFGNAPKNSAELRLASAQSLRQVSEFGLNEQEGAQARAFVGQFEARPGNTAWPEDLFRPEPGKRSEARSIPLPNGESGTKSVAIEANPADSTGLLSSFARTVTTKLGGSARVTEEIWTLTGKG